MQVHPELSRFISELDLAQESKELLFAALLGVGKEIAPNDALRLLWLLDSLMSGKILGLMPLQKMQWLDNLVNLLRQGHEEWVFTVSHILYEGDVSTHEILPSGMIRDLVTWVNLERTDKARGVLWSILLRKDTGLAGAAGVADVAAGLCEKDPITRNNIIRFLYDNFTPDEVVQSLFQYTMASGKRVPGLVFKRYASLLKDQKGQQQKKYILEKILSTAKLDDKEIDEIFSEYINSLNRFDLIRLMSTTDNLQSGLVELNRKGNQMGFPFDHGSAAFAHSTPFLNRISQIITQALP